MCATWCANEWFPHRGRRNSSVAGYSTRQVRSSVHWRQLKNPSGVSGEIGNLTKASYNLNLVVHNPAWASGHFHLTVSTILLILNAYGPLPVSMIATMNLISPGFQIRESVG